MSVRSVEAEPAERRFLIQEHRELVTGLAQFDEIVQDVGRFPNTDLAWRLGNLTRWLESALKPHTAWEEAWLYPRLDEIADTTWLARLLSFDHEQICERIAALELETTHLTDGATGRHRQLVAHLDGLDVLIRAHIEREERFVLPLLDETAVHERHAGRS